ncbi:signal transduction histidine kinase, LytS [Paraglaciecola sp. T6c]|uniref:sensor histidine kinase n=1 Tax=Pseudoalteromonas atlantica (strain T6c / ATCC BAA-1087) TaxID=3042615 RepID=UPI00005C6ECE|nr:histidine kinase [Paraglaciecola sp. T6c]ABG39676.1 signal transduction histidine kinase, LytS [Paraglaciecola sp. T6c]
MSFRKSLGEIGEAKPSFWTLHLFGWSFYVLIFTIEYAAFNPYAANANYLIVMPLLFSGLVGGLLTWPLRYIYGHLSKGAPLQVLLVIITVCMLIAVIWTPIKNLLLMYFFDHVTLYDLYLGNQPEGFHVGELFLTVTYSFFMIMVWSCLYFGINYHFKLLHEKQLHLEAIRLSHVAQIKMLRYQINPHFLFNTLNAISTLVLRGDKSTANKMLVGLATFLRFSLDNDPEQKIRLRDEIKALMLYLDIEKKRFAERLNVHFDIEAATNNLLVPGLLLQPLVENAIKYAIAQMETGGIIEINARIHNNLLHLTVAVNGPNSHSIPSSTAQLREEGQRGGVGLKNVMERLQVLYAENHQFSIQKSPHSGCAVNIVLPVELRA